MNKFQFTTFNIYNSGVFSAIEFARDGQVAQSKTYDALQMQIWSLLPGFCTRPRDLRQVSLHDYSVYSKKGAPHTSEPQFCQLYQCAININTGFKYSPRIYL